MTTKLKSDIGQEHKRPIVNETVPDTGWKVGSGSVLTLDFLVPPVYPVICGIQCEAKNNMNMK